MIIGYDAKRAFYNSSGLGNYSRSLITAIHQYFPQEQLVLFSPGAGSAAYKSFIKPSNNVAVITPQGINALFHDIWRVKGIKGDIQRMGVKVYHGLSNELPLSFPLKNVKSVVTIHDLIFKRYPQFYPFMDRAIYDYKSRTACKKADRIIATSEQTKKDIIDFYKIPAEKIEVIYQAVGDYLRHDISADEKVRVRNKFNLPQQYILSVGTIEERKNLLPVIEALAVLGNKVQLPMVIVGKPTAYKQKLVESIAKHKLEGRVIFLEGVSTEDLQPLYAGASLFIYNSLFEGFGIPVIEALHYGIPVIAANGSSLKEAGGLFSKYVKANDIEDISVAINGVLSDVSLALKMREEGKKYVQKFNAKQFAEDTMRCYQTL